jgi:hypothetical protein
MPLDTDLHMRATSRLSHHQARLGAELNPKLDSDDIGRLSQTPQLFQGFASELPYAFQPVTKHFRKLSNKVPR